MGKQDRKFKQRVLTSLPAWFLALSPKLTAQAIFDLGQEKRKRKLAKAPQAR